MFMDIMKGLFICRYAMKHVYVLKKSDIIMGNM